MDDSIGSISRVKSFSVPEELNEKYSTLQTDFIGQCIENMRVEMDKLPVLPEDMEYRTFADPYVYDKETDSYSFVVHYVPMWKVGTIHKPAPPQD